MVKGKFPCFKHFNFYFNFFLQKKCRNLFYYIIYILYCGHTNILSEKKMVKDSIPGAFVSSAKLSLGALST